MQANDVFGHWNHVRRGLVEALDQLTDGQLGFVPRDGLWSLGQVACHIADAEDGWFRYCLWKEVDGWPPDMNARDCATVAAVKERLRTVHARTETFLAASSMADLQAQVALPWGPTVSAQWIVWHVLEHEIHHRGEIYLMLGLMGMEAPDV